MNVATHNAIDDRFADKNVSINGCAGTQDECALIGVDLPCHVSINAQCAVEYDLLSRL